MNLINRILSFLGYIFRYPGIVTVESDGAPSGNENTITGYAAERTDTGERVMCGIGQGGTNHGVYSPRLNNWIIHANENNEVRIPASNVFISGLPFGKNNVLWTGAWYMSEGHTVTFADGQKVTNQANGIVLCWSAYKDGQAQNYDWAYQFVPKWHASSHAANGVCVTMTTNGFGYIGSKYVYVYNDKITGHKNNTLVGTSNGVKYTNNYWVLRAVIGV